MKGLKELKLLVSNENETGRYDGDGKLSHSASASAVSVPLVERRYSLISFIHPSFLWQRINPMNFLSNGI